MCFAHPLLVQLSNLGEKIAIENSNNKKIFSEILHYVLYFWISEILEKDENAYQMVLSIYRVYRFFFFRKPKKK